MAIIFRSDRVVAELHAEVETLRETLLAVSAQAEQNEEKLLLYSSPFAITGPEGSPIYVCDDELDDCPENRRRMIYAQNVHEHFHTGSNLTQCTLGDLRDCEVHVHGFPMGNLFHDAHFYFRLSIDQIGLSEDEKSSRNILDRYTFRRSFICEVCNTYDVEFCIQDYNFSKELCLQLAGIEDFMTKPQVGSVYRVVSLADVVDAFDDEDDTGILFNSYSKG